MVLCLGAIKYKTTIFSNLAYLKAIVHGKAGNSLKLNLSSNRDRVDFQQMLLMLLKFDCLQSLELWNMAVNKCMTISAHECVISALAQSPATGMVASASHDKSVKIWK